MKHVEKMTAPSLLTKFVERYSLDKQNIIQKSGFFAFASTAILLVFLHFPFYGYDIYKTVENGVDYSNCQKGEYPKFCAVQRYRDELRPIAEWRSSSPVLPWLGNVVNLLLSVAYCAGVGAFWLVTFESASTSSQLLPRRALLFFSILFAILLTGVLITLEIQLWTARSQLASIARSVEATQFNIVEQSTGERIESTLGELDQKLKDLDRKLDDLDQKADRIKSAVDIIYLKE